MSTNRAAEQANRTSVERYEAAHARLMSALPDRTRHDTQLPKSSFPLANVHAIQRATVLEGGLRLLAPLRRFVRHEFERQNAEWLLARNELSVDDILGATLTAAIEQSETAPAEDGLYHWLRRLAQREVQLAHDEYREEQRSEQSVETPLSVVGAVWPTHIRRLKNILADPTATLPEEVVEHEETAAVLAEVLGRLPERWREVFLLQAVDGWTDAEIADVEGLDPADVSWIAQASRAFAREWVETGHLIERA